MSDTKKADLAELWHMIKPCPECHEALIVGKKICFKCEEKSIHES